MQPTNASLYRSVVNGLRELGGRERETRDVVRAVRAAFDETGRAPAGTSARDWQRQLDRDEVAVYSGDSGLTEERIAELEAQIAKDARADDRLWCELAQLHEGLQRDARVLETLRAATEACPESVRVRAGLALTLEGEQDYATSAEEYARLVELLERSDARAREQERLEENFRRSKRGLLQGFPLHVQSRTSDEVLRRLYRTVNGPTTHLGWHLGEDPSPDGARLRQAKVLFKLERA